MKATVTVKAWMEAEAVKEKNRSNTPASSM